MQANGEIPEASVSGLARRVILSLSNWYNFMARPGFQAAFYPRRLRFHGLPNMRRPFSGSLNGERAHFGCSVAGIESDYWQYLKEYSGVSSSGSKDRRCPRLSEIWADNMP